MYNVYTHFPYISGGVLGYGAGKVVGEITADFLIEKIYGNTPSKATENAYKYLGINSKATDKDIMEASRKKSSTLDSDSEEDRKEYFILQNHVQIIKESRR